ncbi:MAG: PilW family protein [Gallionella sp.]
MYTTPKQSGFSLIEILIGMTIGLIVILVIMQTMSLFEGQRKTSSSTADMQSNGLLSLYTLEQDVRLAGYGLIVNFNNAGELPCVKINGYGASPGVFDAIPLYINTSGVLDSITIARLDTATGGLTTGGRAATTTLAIPNQAALVAAAGINLGIPAGILKVSGTPQTVGFYPANAINSSNFAYQAGATPADSVLISSAQGVAPLLDCSLVEVSALVSNTPYIPEVPAVPAVVNSQVPPVPVSAVGLNGVKIVGSVVQPAGDITPAIPAVPAVPATSVMSFTAVNNPGFDTAKAPVFPAGGYPANSTLHNLGANPTLTRTTFAVNALRQFTKQINDAPAEVVAENIVNMQAQYGISTPGAGLNPRAITCWVNPTAAGTNLANAVTCPAGDAADWTLAGLQAVPANMRRIKAIRLAIVARNNLREKADKGVCTTSTAAPISWLGGPVVDLSADLEWQCYRYKVYQTIIPLHNVIMGNI